MKRNVMKSVLCLMMILAMLMAPLSASAASVARIMKTNTDWVRLRTAGGAQITSLRKGTKVLYWGSKNDDMYKVMLSNGVTGYIYKYYLSTYGAMQLDSVYITTTATPAYNRSGSTLKRSGTLAKGKYVMVYKTSGNWAYVKTMNGKGAFVPKGALAKVF